MNSRGAVPEHFFRALEHGLGVVLAGAAPTILLSLSRGAIKLGLVDASEGYTHAYLRLMSKNL